MSSWRTSRCGRCDLSGRESLRLQRPDHGDDITSLSRSDITAFLNRLAYLAGQGQLSASTRVNICRSVRGMLSRMRAELGLTRAGELLHGLLEDFALGRHDVPGRNEECIEPVPAAARVSGSARAWRQDRRYLREPPDSAGGGFRCRA